MKKTMIDILYRSLIIARKMYNKRGIFAVVFLIVVIAEMVTIVIDGLKNNQQREIILLLLFLTGAFYLVSFWFFFSSLAKICQMAYSAEKERILSILTKAGKYLNQNDIQNTLKENFVHSHPRAFFLDLVMEDILEELVWEGRIEKIPSSDILNKPINKDWGLEPNEWLYAIS